MKAPVKQNKTDTLMAITRGSTGKLNTAPRIAADGERITDANMKRRLIFFPRVKAHINGRKTTEALKVIDMKPRSLIA